ncbi:type II toxin-antitoxin system YafQ family toxin [Parabacteroides sp.]|uniref:type II toxin-antitoxin system YafQ family toxin n=1 Tax=Parabacteroides sp. TaxID=1869337 RepID=UPI0025802575|nr:type II toxin-antitoxin system YafQ family toxin [Parabacteroides sp.]
MKKRLHPTSQFKRDFKRIRKFPEKVSAFERIANMLINDHPIPQEYKPHLLKGYYKGCMECHIEDDFLLIWTDGDIIDLLRIGSHSELFGKKK